MKLKLFIFMINILGHVLAQWPDCMETGFDYDGMNVITGYRTSNDGCAHWCKGISRCVRWVFNEDGSLCSIKADEGNQVQVNMTNELFIYSGLPSCHSPDPIIWPDCAIQGEKITGNDHPNVTLNNGYDSPDIESCSKDCQNDADCMYWVYRDNVRLCSMKTGVTLPTTPDVTHWYGEKSCVGRVSENSNGNDPIDGNWSPWSSLATPCIDKKTGEKVSCGGGVRLKFRSCTDPEPRFGGKVCPGPDRQEFPCNTHSCALPDPFHWSAFGPPEEICKNSTQKRTTLCGAVRRRLPPLPGKNPDDPAVYWPSCMVPRPNVAAPLSGPTVMASLSDCFEGCKADANCHHWTFNLDSNECSFFDVLSINNFDTLANYVTGEKNCRGTLYAPYCGEYQTNYVDAPVIETVGSVEKMGECSKLCFGRDDCHNWYLEVNDDGSMTCELRGELPTGASSSVVNVNGTWAFFGPKTCEASEPRPALPEEAEELSYKEVCIGNQYKEEIIWNNTWNMDYCPSPCLNNGDCPKYAQCYDLSTPQGPAYECKCQLGKRMEGGRCISPPPSTPPPRPTPELPDGQDKFTKGITRLVYFLLIFFCILTLIIFGIFKILNPGRFIHMNIEIALILAYICLIPDVDGKTNESVCRNLSICVHFFFTAAFSFFVLEGIFVYACVSYAVRKDGLLSNMGNFMAGWGMAIIVIAFTVSFEFDNYGGEYHCFLQMNTGLIYGEFVPIVVMSIVSIMLIEAGTNVNEEDMPPLEGTDQVCLTSARYMLKSMFLRLVLTFLCFAFGTTAFYEQSLGLFMVFVILTGVLGVVIFISHCMADEKIRGKLSGLKEKMCGKEKPETTDTEPIIQDQDSLRP